MDSFFSGEAALDNSYSDSENQYETDTNEFIIQSSDEDLEEAFEGLEDGYEDETKLNASALAVIMQRSVAFDTAAAL